MNNRFVKILICVVMISCLLFSFTINSYATFPGQIGEFGGAIASIIAGSMGIDFDYREMSVESINEFLGIVSDLHHDIWVAKAAAGVTAIAFGKQALDELSQYIKDLVTDQGLQDNSQGSIWSDITYIWNGIPLHQPQTGFAYYYSYPLYTFTFPALTRGQSYTASGGDITVEFTCTYRSGTQIECDIRYYYAGNYLGTYNSRLAVGSTYNLLYILSDTTTRFIYAGFARSEGTTFYGPYFVNNSIGAAVYTEQSWSYRTGHIDTTVADNLPATGGAIISMPTTSQGTMDEILTDISDMVLSNETENLSIEYVQDVGQPVITDQTIADTPWTDLAGTLDQIKAYLRSTQTTISGEISGFLEGIKDGVDAITEDIALGTSQTVKVYIDSFIELYLPWIQELGSHSSIWHYVVSWIGSISSCFSWSLSAVSSAGSIFMAPIYATFAGTVVIAIYRRFGR